MYFLSFLLEHDELLEKYNENWEKVKNSIKNELDSEPVYNEKYLKAKIKSNNGKINNNFRDNKIPIEGSQFIFLSIVLVDSVFRTCKYFCKNVNMLLKKKRCLSTLLMTVYSCHVTKAFQSESTLYSHLNVKELLARSRRGICRPVAVT